jgi:outer membrane receptor for ferrienterochelin and colicins
LSSISVFLALAILGVCFTNVSAAATVVSGSVTDRTTGSAVVGATVYIQGTRLGAVTNAAGAFSIKRVPTGNVQIKISSIGYSPEVVTLTLERDVPKNIVVTLMPREVLSNQVVVSANKRVTAIQDVPISVATLSSADLNQRGIVGLDEALRYVPGVSVARDQVNIRGASGFALGVGSRTAVLLDGFSLLSGDNNDIKFDVLPVRDIERVEVIKGAGSALYGTGALGGVVSMVSKPAPESLLVNLRLYSGAYQLPEPEQWRYRTTLPFMAGADVRAAQRLDDVSITLSAGVRSDESYRDYDKQLRGYVYAKGEYQASDDVTFKLFGFGTAEEKQNFLYWRRLNQATLTTDDVVPNEVLQTSKVAIAGEYSHLLSGTTSLIVRPGFFRTFFGNVRDGIAQDSNTSTASSTNAEVFVTSQFLPEMALTTGAVFRYNVVESDMYSNATQLISSAYSQAEVTLGRAIITAGLRGDYEHTYGNATAFEVSPKLGVSYAASPELALRASVGRGFRAASIAERYAAIRYGPFTVTPNLQLKPESSISGEIGARYTPQSMPFEIDGAIFNNELYSMIEPTFVQTNGNLAIQFLNLTRARVVGAEVTCRAMVLSTVGVETGITAMNPIDFFDNTTLKYRNNILWYSKASWVPASWIEVQTDYRFQNRIERIDDRITLFVRDGDARVPIHIVDARCIVTMQGIMPKPLTLTFNVRNVLNYRYAEIIGNLAPTRNMVLQLEYTM